MAGFVGLDGLVAAGLAAAVSLGWLDWSAEQVAAVVGFVAALSAVVAGVVRRFVTPASRVEGLLSDASDEGFVTGFELGLFTPVPKDAGEWLDAQGS